jgi:hypothetical protein
MEFDGFSWSDANADGISDGGLGDTTGDGLYDSSVVDADDYDGTLGGYGYDTNVEGVDTVHADTTLAGQVDTIGTDSGGEGIIDTAVPPAVGSPAGLYPDAAVIGGDEAPDYELLIGGEPVENPQDLFGPTVTIGGEEGPDYELLIGGEPVENPQDLFGPTVTVGSPDENSVAATYADLVSHVGDPWEAMTITNIINSQIDTAGVWTLPDGFYREIYRW